MPELTMTEDEALFAAAVASPDRTPWLALADWFDEHDEPALALALREEPQLIPFLVQLQRWDTTPVWGTWNGWNDEYPTLRAIDTRRFALAACRFLSRFPRLFPIPPNAPTDFDPVAKPTTQPKRAPLPEELLSRWTDARTRQVKKLREQAARAATEPPQGMRMGLQPPLDDAERFEFIACLLHEAVLRERNATVDIAEQALREHGHPLGWLPPFLLEIELELRRYLPRFYQSGYGLPGAVIAPLPVSGHTEPSEDAPAITHADEVPPDSPAFAAVRCWRDESNGRLEAKRFRLSRPLDRGVVGTEWFARLPADSLAGAMNPPPWLLNRATPPATLALLFTTAQSGGAYGTPAWGAYGRLYAWQSLGWLVGCVPNADAITIAAEAGRCEWFAFSGTQWFYSVAWDLGLICIRPDRCSVAVLAATDCD
jgi:uncharacterized protein (TIGR02996 family)